MPPRTRPARHLLAALPFLFILPACDNAPPPAPAAVAAPEPAPTPVTAADLHGDWVIRPADMRDAAFNSLLAQAVNAGRGDEFTDREIEQHLPKRLELMNANPSVYTFNPDGSFSATAGPDNTVGGTWTLEGNVVTITSDSVEKPIRFELSPGVLSGIGGGDPRRRPIMMVRR